ncbi:MAG: sodium-independent anion transporter, partial [Proteobacteria bacterium]|nr:sodium-independent anion transporter [Pseudomonadota bacterium]
MLTIGIIVGIQRLKPSLPSLLIAVVSASVVAALFSLPVETIGTRFGGIPQALPALALPEFSWATA